MGMKKPFTCFSAFLSTALQRSLTSQPAALGAASPSQPAATSAASKAQLAAEEAALPEESRPRPYAKAGPVAEAATGVKDSAATSSGSAYS